MRVILDRNEKEAVDDVDEEEEENVRTKIM